MSARRLGAAALVPMLLSGCLEVNQHPVWLRGKYQGKVDNLPYQVHFHNDKLAWSAALTDRNLKQDEYVRAQP